MYASLVTRDYLMYLGITNCTEDGKIFRNNKEMNQTFGSDGYVKVCLYDPAIRQLTPKEKRTNRTGEFFMGVHRVIYAWFNYIVPAGMVVDHINNNKSDNRLCNLQLLTPGENIWKDRNCSTRLEKCKLNKPRSFYEEKLDNYLTKYEDAKINKDKELAHKLRTNISSIRARLRYYDKNIEEYLEIKEAEMNQIELKNKTKLKKEQINYIISYFRYINKDLWHKWCKIRNNPDSISDEAIKLVLDEIAKNH